MSAEQWNWRDEFEETDRAGSLVLNVWNHEGVIVGYYAQVRTGHRYSSESVDHLIHKPKPKKYRPWTLDEVPVGAVVMAKKEPSSRFIIVSVSYGFIRIGQNTSGTPNELLANYTLLDNSPCGVEE